MLLLSAAADLYWLGRYLSRSQQLVALLLDSLQKASLDDLGIPLSLTGSWQSYYQQHMILAEEGLAEFFVSTANPASLSNCLQAMRSDAQATRGCISHALWLTMNSLYLEWQSRLAKPRLFADNLALYAWLQPELDKVQQLLDDDLANEANQFIRMGQLLEEIDYGLRQHAVADLVAPVVPALRCDVASLLKEVNSLRPEQWSRVQQTTEQLQQAVNNLPEAKATAATSAVQQVVQQFTHRLADVFAA